MATPAPAAAPMAPKFLGALGVTADRPKAGALDLNTGFAVGVATEGTNAALRLLASSSSTCFLAKAWRSDQVSFLPLLGVEGLGVDDCCCSIAANGFFNFFGAGRLTGV